MDIETIATQIAQTIQKEANVNAIFGEPRKLDEHVIIPVARVEISLGAGGGGGTGPSPKPEGEEASTSAVGGTGGGGGLDIKVRPLGFIRDGSEGAEFVAIDETPEGLLGKVEHLIKGLRGGQLAVEGADN